MGGGGWGGGFPYKESFILGVKTRFGVPYGDEPQKLHSRSFCGTCRKKYDRRHWAVLELVLLRLKRISSHTHKTGSWYFLGVLLKIPDEHPCPFSVLPGIFSIHLLTLKCSVYQLNLVFDDFYALRNAHVQSCDRNRQFKYSETMHFILSILRRLLCLDIGRYK